VIALLLASACTLGIEVTNISDRIRADRSIPDFVAGAFVRVASGDIQAGDVIQAVGDHLIQNTCEFDRELTKRTACRDVDLTIRRAGETIKLNAKLRPRKGAEAQDCTKQVPTACTALGVQHKAVDLFKLGCDLGDAEGCYLFAVNVGERDPGARAAYRQACEGGNALACTNLGWMMQFGHGGKADDEQAVDYYRKGCKGSCSGSNNVGCVNLARMIRDGVGTKQDVEEANRIFGDVCERSPINAEDRREIARACSLAGTALLTQHIPRALALLDKGCSAGDSFGCFNLGSVYSRGEVVKEDKARGMEYFRKACVTGDEEACGIVRH
jgi:TPR repeat protein